MATLESLKTTLNTPTVGNFVYSKNIGEFAQTHFKSAQKSYFTTSCLNMASKTLCALTGVGAGLAYYSIGKKYEFITKLYDKCTPRYVAVSLLTASILFAALSYWCHTSEFKNTDALRDALESDDVDAIIKAYQKSGMPPAILMKEAAMKDNKIGITLAALLIENDDLRLQAATKAHPFAAKNAGKDLTTKFGLKHACFSKNLQHSIEKGDENLFQAISEKPQMKFEVKIRDLATTYFKDGAAAARKRRHAKYAAASCSLLTGVITPLVYLGKGQKYAPIAKLYQKFTTRNIAIACAVAFVAATILWKALVQHENHLTSQLLSATQLDEPYVKKILRNIYLDNGLPQDLNGAIKTLSKGMVDADQVILRTILEQNPDIYTKHYDDPNTVAVKICNGYQTLRILAALKAKGLDPSASTMQKASLLAKITSTEPGELRTPAINAFIAHLSEKERKPVIHSALLQTNNFGTLMGVVEEADTELFETNLNLLLKEIQTASNKRKIVNHLVLYTQLAKKCKKAEELPEWSEAPNRPQKPLSMDKIVDAFEKSTISNKKNFFFIDEDKKANQIYTFTKDTVYYQMSKASAKIMAKW